jgi:hypothetical protein
MSHMENQGPYGVSETIGDWDYLRSPTGDLYRARAGLPAETRSVEFVVPRAMAEFALRCARLDAGLPEYRT